MEVFVNREKSVQNPRQAAMLLKALPEVVDTSRQIITLTLSETGLQEHFVSQYIAPALSALLSKGILLGKLYIKENFLTEADLQSLWRDILKPQYDFLDTHNCTKRVPTHLYLGDYPAHDSAIFVEKVLQRQGPSDISRPLWLYICQKDIMGLLEQLLRNCSREVHQKMCIVSARKPECESVCGDKCVRPSENRTVHLFVPPAIRRTLIVVNSTPMATLIHLKMGLGDLFGDINKEDLRPILWINAMGLGQSGFLFSLVNFLARVWSVCTVDVLNLSGNCMTDDDLRFLVDLWLVNCIELCKKASKPLPRILDLSDNNLTEKSVNYLLEAVKEAYKLQPLKVYLTGNKFDISKVNEDLVCSQVNCLEEECEYRKPVHAPLWKLRRLSVEGFEELGDKTVVCVGASVGSLFEPDKLLQKKMQDPKAYRKIKESTVFLFLDSAFGVLSDVSQHDNGAARYFMENTLNQLAIDGVAFRQPVRKRDVDCVVVEDVRKKVKGRCLLLGEKEGGKSAEYILRYLDLPDKEELLKEAVEMLSGFKAKWKDCEETRTVFVMSRMYLNEKQPPNAAPPTTTGPHVAHQKREPELGGTWVRKTGRH
eukprot:TRINITY_DN17503_c0_g2_i1.p1 TRINITY_DN17503_c0_g2~~TRINITY_DN17503_c0_g2_i1.p1  ORF type:complete len:640 (+),score=164.06 TRINITY_DN17503_c0_g2_i1:134-1921(+)